MRPRSIVFDLFGDYLRYRGGSARLLALVSLLEAFGVPESTARVALARLRREGWFDTKALGRETIYTLSAKSWAMLDEGRARIFDRDTAPWDGQWRMVIYEVPEAQRGVRDEVRQELAWLGFGPLATFDLDLAARQTRYGGRPTAGDPGIAARPAHVPGGECRAGSRDDGTVLGSGSAESRLQRVPEYVSSQARDDTFRRAQPAEVVVASHRAHP